MYISSVYHLAAAHQPCFSTRLHDKTLQTNLEAGSLNEHSAAMKFYAQITKCTLQLVTESSDGYYRHFRLLVSDLSKQATGG